LFHIYDSIAIIFALIQLSTCYVFLVIQLKPPKHTLKELQAHGVQNYVTI